MQFGFFFNLDGDSGCDPQSPSSLGHSQGLAALANVSGHELSEMLTDPQLNAWYDQQGDRELRQVRLDLERHGHDRRPELEDPGQLEQRGRNGPDGLRERGLHPDQLVVRARLSRVSGRGGAGSLGHRQKRHVAEALEAAHVS